MNQLFQKSLSMRITLDPNIYIHLVQSEYHLILVLLYKAYQTMSRCGKVNAKKDCR